MTFADFCSTCGVTKAEVEPLFEYWCLLRTRAMRVWLARAKRRTQ